MANAITMQSCDYNMDITWQVGVVSGLERHLVHCGHDQLHDVLRCDVCLQAAHKYRELITLDMMPCEAGNSHHEYCLGDGAALSLAIECVVGARATVLGLCRVASVGFARFRGLHSIVATAITRCRVMGR